MNGDLPGAEAYPTLRQWVHLQNLKYERNHPVHSFPSFLMLISLETQGQCPLQSVSVFHRRLEIFFKFQTGHYWYSSLPYLMIVASKLLELSSMSASTSHGSSPVAETFVPPPLPLPRQNQQVQVPDNDTQQQEP